MLPERLRRLRSEMNMSQRELGNALGLSKGTISMYETGNRIPEPHTLEAIADFFNVSMDYLYGRSDVRRYDSKGQPVREVDIEIVIKDGKAIVEGPLTDTQKTAIARVIEAFAVSQDGKEE